MANQENLAALGLDSLGWPNTDYATERELTLMYSALVARRREEEHATLEHVDWPIVL